MGLESSPLVESTKMAVHLWNGQEKLVVILLWHMTESHAAQLKDQLPWPHNAAYCPQLVTDQYQIVQFNFKAD